MIKIYVSTNEPKEEYLSFFAEKLDYADTLSDCDKMLVFLDSDTKKAKQDINYALDKKKPVVYITSDDYNPDKGLEMQLGLETGFTDKDDRKMVLEALLKESPKPEKKSSKGIVIAVIIAVIAAVFAFILIPKTAEEKSTGSPESEEAQENQITDKPEIIKMDDKLLKALVEKGLDKDGNGFISKDELLDVNELDLSGKELTDITGLIYAENLRVLNLSDNSITDIKALVTLKQLEELDITGNQITDYSYIDYLPAVKKVSSDSSKSGKGN